MIDLKVNGLYNSSMNIHWMPTVWSLGRRETVHKQVRNINSVSRDDNSDENPRAASFLEVTLPCSRSQVLFLRAVPACLTAPSWGLCCQDNWRVTHLFLRVHLTAMQAHIPLPCSAPDLSASLIQGSHTDLPWPPGTIPVCANSPPSSGRPSVFSEVCQVSHHPAAVSVLLCVLPTVYTYTPSPAWTPHRAAAPFGCSQVPIRPLVICPHRGRW